MTQKELEQKVIDAEGRVAKREAVLKKHNSQLAKMIEKGADRFDISIKREDIKSATSKLAEARETLANWQDKLNTRITRDAYLEANTPEILKDFLENWKQHAIAYYRQRRIDVIEFRKDLKAQERAARLEALQTLPSLERARKLYEGREVTDYDLANLWPRKDVDEFLHERVEDHLDRWIPDDVWNRAEPYARHKNEVNRQRHPEIDYYDNDYLVLLTADTVRETEFSDLTHALCDLTVARAQ